MLIYKATTYLSIILDSTTEVAEELLRAVPKKKGILFIPSRLLPIVRVNISNTGIYAEDQMSVTQEREKLYPSRIARRLTADDAKEVTKLYSSEDVRGSRGWNIVTLGR